MGPDQMQGWTRRISGDMHVGPQFIEGRQEPYDGSGFARQKWSNTKEVMCAGIGRGPCVTHDEYAVEGAVQFINDYFNSSYYDREQQHPVLLKDEWIVIYTSDHGEIEQNVNLCDLFATICDLADVPVPEGLDSRTLFR